MIKIKRGLDVPIQGTPRTTVLEAPKATTVGLLGSDFVGVKPTFAVRVGDQVKEGSLLFTDKKNEGVRFTSPACGRVTAINRGDRRALLSVEIAVEGNESEAFHQTPGTAVAGLRREEVRDRLVASGMWTALRRRPFSKIPALNEVPSSIFITASDSNPLAVDPTIALNRAGLTSDFLAGVEALKTLTDGPVHVCLSENGQISMSASDRVRMHRFSGPHPSGLVGTHIHLIDPATRTKPVWYIGLQDVVAIGKLLTTGRLWLDRYVTFSGTGFREPALYKTRLGADLSQATAGLLDTGRELRLISGSVLFGQLAQGATRFLGRYACQVTAIPEGRHRDLLGWKMPGFKRYSLTRAYASAMFPKATYDMTTNKNGSDRAMVPIGLFEQVLPFETEPVFLLRSLLAGDLEGAEALGALELDEEDLALCTFVSPGKIEFGPVLRERLTTIEKEG